MQTVSTGHQLLHRVDLSTVTPSHQHGSSESQKQRQVIAYRTSGDWPHTCTRHNLPKTLAYPPAPQKQGGRLAYYSLSPGFGGDHANSPRNRSILEGRSEAGEVGVHIWGWVPLKDLKNLELLRVTFRPALTS